MAKIVFFCIPAHGHINPTLEVVRELVRRGHQVWYYSYEHFREKIEGAGARFVPCDRYDQQQRLSPRDGARIGKDIAFSIQVLVDTTLALDEAVMADMAALRPDCIVADSMAPWGKLAAWKLGLPFVSSTTTFAFNRHSAKTMDQSPGQLLSLLLALPKLGREVKRLRAKGYPIRSFLDLIQNDDETDTIVYTSPEFQPRAETFSDHYTFVGPSIRPAESAIQKTCGRLIYLSMGTVNNDMLPLYRRFLLAFREAEDIQLILSVGDQVPLDAFGPLPDHISVCPSVDQIAVLQKADLFFTHCGMNSASEALYFGVPLIMLPQTQEQSAVAHRVRALGAGLLLKEADTEAILSAARQVLEDPSYRSGAQAIAQSFRRCSGAPGAADKILGVCS